MLAFVAYKAQKKFQNRNSDTKTTLLSPTDNLMHYRTPQLSCVYIPSSHYRSVVCFFVSHCSVDLCLGHYGVGLVCVSKVTNMTCNLLWTRQEVRAWHTSHRNQATACILQTGVNIRPVFSRHEPTYILQSPD